MNPSALEAGTPLAVDDAIAPAAPSNSGGQVVRYALAMALGTTSSRVLGLVREIIFAALFPRAVTDAWIAAFRLPNMFRRLFGEGSLSVSFVPVFVEARVRDDGSGRRARVLMDGFFTLLVGFLATLTVLGILFPEPVLRVLLDPEYVAQTEKFLLTVHMARIMFGFVFLICVYAYFMGILNALGVYGLPAMAPMLFNVAMIVSTLLPTDRFSSVGDGLAWGVIIGGVLQAGLLVPALMKRGYLPRLSFHWNADIAKVLTNMVPGLFGLGLLQITTLVNMRFASQLGEGPISWINWADRLLELPLSLISVSLGTALLPTLSDLWARGHKEKMSETMNFTLRLNVYVCMGAALGLYFLAEPIVRVIFEHGRFRAEDTLATAGVLRVWALIMIPTACVRVLAPSYYAIKNTWFPACVSAFCLAVHVTIAPLMMERWGLTGLNLSSLTSATLNFTLLMVFYRVLIAPFAYGRLFLQVLRFLVPGIALVAVVHLHPFLVGFLGGTFPAQLAALGLSIFAGALAYAVVSHWMNLNEWNETARRLLGKIRGRLKRRG